MQDTCLIAMDLYLVARPAGKPTDCCTRCGAGVAESVKGCLEAYTGLSERGHGAPIIMVARFSGVDAHALQHREIYGRKNIAGRLLRLRRVFAHRAEARGAAAPRWWQRCLNADDVSILDPPANRGAVTVMDVRSAGPREQTATKTQDGARAVYQAWHSDHAWAHGACGSF